jgi:subtilisin family serine protease
MPATRQPRRLRRRFLALALALCAAVAAVALMGMIVVTAPIGTTVGITHARGAMSISRPHLGAHAAQADGRLDGLHAVWTNAAMVPAPGGSGAVVAIVDSGADLQHSSLQQHLWTNPGEIPGNRVDDDGNGFVDDVHGANILAPGSPPDDGYGHGTAVAGLVAAGDDEASGVTGAAPGARLMIVRVLGDNGEGNTEQLAAGIAYAVRNHASVINCSVNSDFDSPAVDTAIASANDADIPVVAAAGNDGLNLDENQTYPATTDSAAVVSVAATQAPGTLAGFSNYGPNSVDLAAPGVDLVTTYTGDSFTTLSGTSAAAPLVSATLADARTARPQATLRQLRAALTTSATHRDVAVINGELDAPAAMDSLTGGVAADQVTPALSVAPTFVRRGTRIVVRTRWSLKTRLIVPLAVVLRVRSGSARGKVLSTRRVVLRGAHGTISAAPVSRRRSGAAGLWLDVRTTGTVNAASVHIAARIAHVSSH